MDSIPHPGRGDNQFSPWVNQPNPGHRHLDSRVFPHELPMSGPSMIQHNPAFFAGLIADLRDRNRNCHYFNIYSIDWYDNYFYSGPVRTENDILAMGKANMIPFGEALRKAREARGLSRGRLWLRIKAKFQQDAIYKDTLKDLELRPKRNPQNWVRSQITSILTELR